MHIYIHSCWRTQDDTMWVHVLTKPNCTWPLEQFLDFYVDHHLWGITLIVTQS